MTTVDLVLLGVAAGFAAAGVFEYFATGIDPTTGGVPLADGETYGPPVPDSLVEGLQ